MIDRQGRIQHHRVQQRSQGWHGCAYGKHCDKEHRLQGKRHPARAQPKLLLQPEGQDPDRAKARKVAKDRQQPCAQDHEGQGSRKRRMLGLEDEQRRDNQPPEISATEI